jgi:Zn-dependent protease with chaperone function
VTGLYVLMIGVAAAVLMPRTLVRAEWVRRSPKLGIAAWYATLTAVTAGAGGALLAWLAPWQGPHAFACRLWHWCTDAADGGHGPAARTLLCLAVLATATLSIRLATSGVTVARSAAARRGHHSNLLAMVGTFAPQWGAIVIDDPRPAAYMLAGPLRRIVLTTGAIEALSEDEIAAVIAHERAHAAGRHDLLLDGARLLATAFPRLGVFATAQAHLTRLIEMAADDIATAHRNRLSLARALVTMASANASLVGQPTLAATGGDAMQRLDRLLTPPRPLTRAHAWIISGALVTLAGSPLLILTVTMLFPGLTTMPVSI